MKKITSALATTAASTAVYLSLALPVFADVDINPCPPSNSQFSTLCDLNSEKIGPVVSSIVTIMLIAAALIALFFLIWGGIRWITSGGDKAKVDTARQTIIASIIGLIIALLAYFVITLVLGVFDLSLTNLTLPKIF